MITYSTCRRCGGLLHITNPDDTVHPLCDPFPTALERLCDDWIAAVLAGDTDLEASLLAQIEAADSGPPRLLEAALLYASWGWPVFPLRPRDKRPATRNGFKDATTDADRIRAWWTRHPDANIGLPTGHAFDVIDVDTPVDTGSLAMILAADGEVHGHVATSSGGIHFYTRPNPGRGNGARIIPKVDYRGAGGYVVAPPPTLGPRGRSWSWVHAPSPVITGKGDTYGRA